MCLVFSPGTTPVSSTLLLGVGIGALFPLSLIVTLIMHKRLLRLGSYCQGDKVVAIYLLRSCRDCT